MRPLQMAVVVDSDLGDDVGGSSSVGLPIAYPHVDPIFLMLNRTVAGVRN